MTQESKQTERVKQLGLLCSQGFPLIKIRYQSKIPEDAEWRNVERRDRGPTDFASSNVAVKSGTVLKSGKYLSIVDIDPRNGGDTAWEYLSEELDLPSEPTFTVRTGSGGRHIYFQTDEPLPKCELIAGVDFQGEGSYCVAPGSVHENGELYRIEDDSDVDDMPESLISFIRDKTAPAKIGFEGTAHFSEQDKVGEGGRDNYMMQVAGMLRRAGLEGKTMFDALMAKNQEVCTPPLSEADIARIARSAGRYEPEPLMGNLTQAEVLAEMVEESKPLSSPTEKLKTEGEPAAPKEDDPFSDALESLEGTLGELARSIHKNAHRPVASWSVAAATAIISAVAQGAYTAPSLNPDPLAKDEGGSLSLYLWITGYASSGKDSYKSAVSNYLKSLDANLVCKDLGSSGGLRKHMYGSNSTALVIDEMQDEIKKIAGAGAQSYMSDLHKQLKEMVNSLPVMEQVYLSSSMYPAVNLPRLTIFAAGTEAGFKDVLTGDVISGGLISRFTLWPMGDNLKSDINFDQSRGFVDRRLLAQLKKIWQSGLTNDYYNQSYAERMAEFDSARIMKKTKKDVEEEKVEHTPSYDPRHQVLALEPAARLVMYDFYSTCNERSIDMVRADGSDSDLSPASVWGRAAHSALKLASLHAIGCGRTLVNTKDCELGIKLSSVLAENLAKKVYEYASSSPYQKIRNHLMKRLVDNDCENGVKRKFMFETARKRHPNKELMQCLESMFHNGEVVCIDANGKCLKEAEIFPKGYGWRYRASHCMLVTHSISERRSVT